MFYYPNVLQRHTGCFSTIWLAATRGSRIVKREYLKVNVIKTCQKIVQYILQQVPPPYHGSPIPRLSLYLSAQLSYGVVCVYHRQCDLLIEEMKTTVERLYRAEKLAKIDLIHTDQPLLLPDNLILMEMLEDAPDPFFGMMEVSPELPEPMMIPQLCMLLETSEPEIVRLEKTPSRHKRTSRKEDTSHLTSPELITIKEVEPAPLPSTEFGQDLPEVSVLDFELLVPEIPPFPEAETLPGSRKRKKSGELDKKEHPKEVRPKEPKKDKETINGIEAEEEKHFRETANELYNMEKEIELLKKEKRQSELQWEHERERERKEVIDREKRYQQEVEREMERLKKAMMEFKQLQSTGATEDLLLKNQKQIENLKKIQKEKQSQWEAERLEQQLKAEERKREHLKELEQERQKIRQAEQEIERLKKAVSEKQADENGIEPDKKMRKEEERIDEICRSETEGLPVTPKSGFPSEMLSEQDAAALLDEVTGQPIAFFPEGVLEIQSPVPASHHVSPRLSSPQLMLPEVPLEAEHLPPVQRPRRKTHLIVDKDTQIESKVMHEKTSDPLICTQPVVPLTIPSIKSQTPASLFDSPTYQKFMAPELCKLWSRCAFLEPLQYIHEREEEVSELEEVRAAPESGASIMMSSEVSLEVSEEERSRPILLTPEERRSLSGQEERVLPMVSEMPEIIVELPETEEVLLSDLQRKLRSEIDRTGQSEFLSLAPHSLSRLLVSRFFFSCLVLCNQEVIHLEQNEPYGRIHITSGRRYSQG
ncbi:meiotic recombination protein REC8 homolog [Hyla sarda]|uniref:meiotic recombination protein REC8 homolog n=1 Tax=Hyla sarda TaxID=327740 RepID=UPI0024C38573|nr:meiotic recombination protein REC8 homolog [Hyla sarda]